MSTVALAIVVGFILTTTLGALEKRPLPAFALTAADGTVIQSQQLVRNGKWVLLYVQRDCRACDLLLQRMKGDDQQALAARIVVVVNGSRANDLGSLSQKYAALTSATWLVDPDRSSMKTLGVAGIPLAIGIVNAKLEWSLANGGNGGVDMLSAIRSWVLP